MADIQRYRRIALAGAAAAVTAAAVVSGAATAGASTPTGQIRAAGAADAVSGSYIVVLKDGPSAQSVNTLSSKYGGTVRHQFSSIHGYSASMSAEAAGKLAADPAVAYVEQNRTVHVAGTQTGADWGLDRIDQANLPLDGSYTYPSDGAGVNAYIIDTGITPTHQEFGGRASVAYDAVGDGQNGIDCMGHGTHVAGTVGGSTYGVAKGVTLYGVRVLDCSGSGTYEGVIAGIDWVAQNAAHPAVANMSLGGGADDAVNAAVESAVASGVTFAIAAGNSSDDACGYSPASAPSAITVGAIDIDDAQAYYSNYGSCVDIYAPGTDITSSWIGSDTATNTISGTSMATPHVAGVAALYLAANPSASPAAVASALTSGATPGVVTSIGAGSPNLLLHVV